MCQYNFVTYERVIFITISIRRKSFNEFIERAEVSAVFAYFYAIIFINFFRFLRRGKIALAGRGIQRFGG